MEENQLKIKVTQQPGGARTDRGLRRRAPWLVTGGMLLVVLLIAGGIFLFWPRHFEMQPSLAPQPTPPSKPAEPTVSTAPDATEQAAQEFAVGDEKFLWVSPTAGEPLELDYLLPGTQLVLHIRVAELLAHAEGEKVMAALGPWGQHAAMQLVSSTGVELPEIETLLLGIRPTHNGGLELALRLRLLHAKTQTQLGKQEQNGRTCFTPDQADSQVLVSCPTDALQELMDSAGRPPLFARELQRVLQRTDEKRIATLAFSGKFLQINGEKFLQGTSQLLREALIDFLGDEATATSLSLHWGNDFFVELQSTIALNTRPHRFAALLAKRVNASSDRVEEVLFSEPLHPYGRKVLARFPAMLRKLGNYTRSAEEEGLGVLRCYLPVTAGHNLLTGIELFLNLPASRGVPALGATSKIFPAKTQALGRRLQQTTSLVFPKETLQKALEILAEDVGVPLIIAGRDLQLEGITKNQSFGIDLRNRPAEEILLAVLLRANPDRTASGPTDVKQKLVYVLREPEEDQPGAIVVTTRAAASRRGEKLPAVFEPTVR